MYLPLLLYPCARVHVPQPKREGGFDFHDCGFRSMRSGEISGSDCSSGCGKNWVLVLQDKAKGKSWKDTPSSS